MECSQEYLVPSMKEANSGRFRATKRYHISLFGDEKAPAVCYVVTDASHEAAAADALRHARACNLSHWSVRSVVDGSIRQGSV